MLKKQNLDLLGSCSPSRCGSCVWRSSQVRACGPSAAGSVFRKLGVVLPALQLASASKFLGRIIESKFWKRSTKLSALEVHTWAFHVELALPLHCHCLNPGRRAGLRVLSAVSCACDLFPFIFWTPSFTSSVRNATPQPFKPQQRKTVKHF